jgi:hypothetical protein
LKAKWPQVQLAVFGSVAVDHALFRDLNGSGGGFKNNPSFIGDINDIDMCLVLPKECYATSDSEAAAAVSDDTVHVAGAEVEYRSSADALTQAVDVISTREEDYDPLKSVSFSKLHVVARARVPVLKFNAQLPGYMVKGAFGENDAHGMADDDDGDDEEEEDNESKKTKKKLLDGHVKNRFISCDFIINNYAALVNSGMQRLAMESSERLRVLWKAVKQWIHGRNLVGGIIPPPPPPSSGDLFLTFICLLLWITCNISFSCVFSMRAVILL